LQEARNGVLSPPTSRQNRFHILNHTDFLQLTNKVIHLREWVSQEEQDALIKRLDLINGIDTQFNGFDSAIDKDSLASVVADGAWGRYFDGVRQLTTEQVENLTGEDVTDFTHLPEADDIIPDNAALRRKYPLKERGIEFVPPTATGRTSTVADPEVTRIKRQRSNLHHKLLIQKLDEHLRNLGAVPKESEHIDMFAEIPGDGRFLFEVKSIRSENLLSQTRKGVSQLYEYRFRYRDDVGESVTLCLVYPHEPTEIEWLQDYLCNDRDIAVCWFEGDELKYSLFSNEKVQPLLISDTR
jgi:hypothetical protein